MSAQNQGQVVEGNTYVYGRGNGNATVDITAQKDFKLDLTSVNFDDIKFEASRLDLILRIKDTGETLTLKKYFWNRPSRHMDGVQFADKTLNTNELSSVDIFVEGTNNDDFMRIEMMAPNLHIYGYDGDDIIENLIGKGSYDIHAGAGNDEIYGSWLDEIYGEEGNDYLSGGYLLDGGAGDDYLEAGPADEQIFVYGKGYGNDTIKIFSIDKMNILNFKDINPDEVEFSIDGQDLKVDVIGTDEGVRIQNYFLQGAFRIDEFHFADGTIMTPDDVKIPEIIDVKIQGSQGNDILTGTAQNDYISASSGNDIISGLDGNDIIYASTGNDKIYGGNGNDRIYGEGGDDYIEGGKGDDYLNGGQTDSHGGSGSDTYKFNLGDGKDVIDDYDISQKYKDVIILGDDALNMTFVKQDDNLVISNMTNDDQITINNWSKGREYQIEEIQSTDGRVLLNTQVDALIDAMSAFETEKGISWNDCVNADIENTSALISQFWVNPTK